MSANQPLPDGSTRVEHDSLGKIEVPVSALYGSNTVRALNNFPLNDNTLGQQTALLHALVQIKKAAAMANCELGSINRGVAEAIVKACEEILSGKHTDHFPVPLLEGSGGTSTNMNVNEVVCNRALQLLNKSPADYHCIHPNDHINMGQSTNDVVPSAIKIAGYQLALALCTELSTLSEALSCKAQEFSRIFRLGRTCLQDAQPMTLGQAFSGYAAAIRRVTDNIESCACSLTSLPLGGTAIGTGMGSTKGFKRLIFRYLCTNTTLHLSAVENPFDGMQNLDTLQRLSAELEAASAVMAKISKDLILLSSGPAGGLSEVALPAVQPGSSIMPGKVNPVLPMAMIQLSQVVHGNHSCIAMACQDGMLEINHYEMAVASRLFDSLNRLTEQTSVFTQKCIVGIRANPDNCSELLQQSYALATALVPELGYSRVSSLVKESVSTGNRFLNICQERNIIDAADIDRILHQATKVVD